MSQSSYYSALLNKLQKGTLSLEETDFLISLLSSDELDTDVAEVMLNQLKKIPSGREIDPKIIASLEARLPAILDHSNEEPVRVGRVHKLRWLRYAAAIIVLVGIGAYFFLFNNVSPKKTNNIPSIAAAKDIPPGKDGAILTLSDGRTMVLDNAANGVISVQNGSKVSLQNDKLVYNPVGKSEEEISYNTLSTPKGRQFKVILPDGSEVWLNAASSIRYPTAFKGNERRVEITGEVYFEVAKNPKMPFHVQVNKSTEIEVLGTHFNINSYDNEESINTTLLEGSVKITYNDEKAMLKPGQQARVTSKASEQKNIKVVNEVDIKKVMAWKNGVFDCEGANLEEVMRQLERWYDIEVVYEKNVPQIEFVGGLGRDLSLLSVLHGLQMSNVHFRLEEGRKLVIMP